MTFEAALAFVLAREGGLVDDPADPGGRTNLGITQSTLDSWRREHPAYPRRVDDLTRALVAPIYREQYWHRAGCGALSSPLCLAVFDTSVNMGPSRALSILRVSAEWEAYLWLRLDAYLGIAKRRPASGKFLAGWCRRMVLLRAACATAAT